MHQPDQRTFLVVPDTYNGGSDFEGFVLAHSPQEACELWHQHIGAEQVTFEFVPERKEEQLWCVRELPKQITVTSGVIPWQHLQCTFWRGRAH